VPGLGFNCSQVCFLYVCDFRLFFVIIKRCRVFVLLCLLCNAWWWCPLCVVLSVVRVCNVVDLRLNCIEFG
jgi:hypothetical protein